MIERAEIKLSELVQMVNLRFLTLEKARELKLSGYIRNDKGGSVALVVEGESDRVDELIAWINSNPGFTEPRIDCINRGDSTGEFKNFEIRF